MLTFRQKLLSSFFILFLVFIVLLFPLATKTVKGVIQHILKRQAEELVGRIHNFSDVEEGISFLRQRETGIFFRVSVIASDGRLLYDSHGEKVLGKRFKKGYIVSHPEVEQALKQGEGYSESFSHLLDQPFVYVALPFQSGEETYVLRTAFPYRFIKEFSRKFEWSFLVIGGGFLFLFYLIAAFLSHYLSRPIKTIIASVRAYSEDRLGTFPKIDLDEENEDDDFSCLAKTLNELADKVKGHVLRLEEEKHSKETILEGLVEGVVAVDTSMNITYVNRAGSEMLGISRNKLFMRPFPHHAYDELARLLRMSLEQGRTFMKQAQKLKRSKGLFDITVVPKGLQRGAILILHDKTAHYRMIDIQKEFIANASHELRTPITVIRGFAETLGDSPHLPEGTEKEATKRIIKNCDRMNKTIKNLLVLADTENLPNLSLQELDLSHMIKVCSSLIREKYPETIIHLPEEMKEKTIIYGDHALLELAFLNLLENAVKYARRTPKITIQIASLEGQIQITFSDEGIGIPSRDLEHVFERFYTVSKSHSRKMGGTGLGLSIVKTIIEKHLGQIVVESVPGQGSTFLILLPINPPLEITEEKEEDEGHS